MAVTSSIFNELNHQLHSLLSGQGLNITAKKIEEYISISHQQCLTRLQNAALSEGLADKEIVSVHIHDYIDSLKKNQQNQKQSLTSLFNRWHSLRKELDESIANQALALAYYHHWQNILKQQAKNYSSLWTWLCEQHDQQYILSFLEQWGCIGHPYHPNFRAKTGFNRLEVIQYSPEFNAQVNIHWAALHRSVAFTSIDESSYSLIFAQNFSEEYQIWHQKLQFQHLEPDHYLPLPLHPWQWDNKLQALCAPLINTKQLTVITHLQKTKPSMSFRTMMPLDNCGPHLKLATAIHTTSAMRTVSPSSVSNSTDLSNWLNHLLAVHEHFGDRLFIARDLAGINTSHPAIPVHEKKHLAMLVRENPLRLTHSSQQLVPLAALFGMSPLSQVPLLIEIIEASKVDPKTYFIDYCHCVLEGQLQLLLRYGIALEAHQQNTLIMFQDNRPVGLVIRDLGGIKICFHPLYDGVAKPILHPDSTITCQEVSELSNTFIHGNLLSNLSPWINCLHAIYGLPIEMLWQQVGQIIDQQLQNCRTEIAPQIYEWHQQKLLSLPWQQKSLLAMRLYQDQDAQVFFNVDNPLSKFHD